MKKLKFNWVDILLVVMVIVLIFGAVSRLSGKVQEITATTETVVYKIQVKTVRQVMADSLKNSIGMQFNMGEKARSDSLGKLIDLQVTPAVDPLEKADGQVVLAEIPERYDIILTLELDATVNNTGYYTPQLSNIGVGTQFIIKNKYIVTQGTVIDLKAKSEL